MNYLKKTLNPDFKDALAIDDYYGELEQNYQSTDSNENRPRLQKLWFNAPPNFGTVQCVLYPSGHDKKVYITHLDDVRQVKFYNEAVNENDDAWHRMLPKHWYPDLTPEESSLYDEVNSLFDYIDEFQTPDEKKLIGFTYFKSRTTWNFFFAKLLKMYDLKNGINKEVKADGTASFLCYPGYKVRSKVKDGLDNLKKKGYGEVKEWSHFFFNGNETGRNGVVQITHSLPQSGGYDSSFEFIFDGATAAPGLPVIKLIPDDFKVTEDDKKLFGNSVIAFMGRMYDFENKRLFNKKVFEAMKNHFLSVISAYNNGGATPGVTAPAPTAPSAPSIPATGHIDPLANLNIPQAASIPVPTAMAIPVPTASVPVPPVPTATIPPVVPTSIPTPTIPIPGMG